MYAAGAFIDLSLPDSPEKVTTPSDAATALKNNTADFLTLRPTDTIEVLDKGRAFLPRLTYSLPIMAKAGWDDLFTSESRAQDDASILEYGLQVLSLQLKDLECTVGGVFVTTGHYLDGFALGPASGKVVAQLVTGQDTDVDLSKFGFSYIDEGKA
jgi:glycine/D-amino acid oxidase-like deaminating enzyme